MVNEVNQEVLEMAELVNRINVEQKAIETIRVDYAIPLEEIANNCCYGKILASDDTAFDIEGFMLSNDLREQFPDNRSGKWIFKVVFQNFGIRALNTPEIIQWGAEQGLVPADLRTALTYFAEREQAYQSHSDVMFNEEVGAYAACIELPQEFPILFPDGKETYCFSAEYYGETFYQPCLHLRHPSSGSLRASGGATWFMFIDPSESKEISATND